MRSFGLTLILALLAVLVCGLAGWQWTQGNFDSVFGAPPTEIGERIYSSFTAADVKYIEISQNGVNTTFELGPKGWYATQPWIDRMDPRAAVGIINFTLGLRVEDFADVSKIDTQKSGLKETGTNIRLEGSHHQPLAKYKLGRQTPWLATVDNIDMPVPTVFIQPRDADHKHYIYAATGDIGPTFKDGLKFLRDHHPFYFNPTALQKVRIRTAEGGLTLARKHPGRPEIPATATSPAVPAIPPAPWRVVQPLDLATDPKAVKALLEGLYELQAVKLTDRASVTLPAGSTAKSGQIALVSFDSEAETVLDIYPPDPPESRTVRATVSDRPETVFDLPLKPEPNLVSLANLPLAINDLRDATLTNLNVKSLRGVLIQPATGTEILITRTPPQPWMATINGQSQEANEERLFTLLKTVTEGRAIGFPSDSATDFSPWGLNRPFLKLRFLGEDNQGLELAFGIDGKGGYFVNRLGTPTVMRVDPSLIAAIPVRPYEWRQSRLWSVDRGSLMQVQRTTGTEPPLVLRYDFDKPDPWSASRDATDLTALLNPTRADYMLGILEGLKVTRWLAPDDASATTALLKPSLAFQLVEKGRDEMGNLTGLITREVILAPATTTGNSMFYYGRMGSDSHPFLLDKDTYVKLATDLLEKE